MKTEVVCELTNSVSIFSLAKGFTSDNARVFLIGRNHTKPG